jgi:hypothetical protein
VTITSKRIIDTSAGAFLTNGGVWTDNPSSRLKKHNESAWTWDEGRRLFGQVDPAMWNYNADQNDQGRQRAGIVAQDLPEWLVPIGPTPRDEGGVMGSLLAGAAIGGAALLFDKQGEHEERLRRLEEMMEGA